MKFSIKVSTALICGSLAVAPAVFSANEKTPAVDADNTGLNKRDQKSGEVTADHQMSGSKEDVETTRLIRRALTQDNSLSTYAQNVKVITLNGKVTLKGPVNSEAERLKVASIAQKTAGKAKSVSNELEVNQH